MELLLYHVLVVILMAISVVLVPPLTLVQLVVIAISHIAVRVDQNVLLAIPELQIQIYITVLPI